MRTNRITLLFTLIMLAGPILVCSELRAGPIPASGKEYRLIIANGESSEVYQVIVVGKDGTHQMKREADGTFTYAGERPSMVYAFPLNSHEHGLTYGRWGGRDTTSLQLIPPIRLRVQVHMVYAPFGLVELKERFWRSRQIADRILQSNHTGVTIRPEDVIFVDRRLNAIDLNDFKCKDDYQNSNSKLSFDPGWINILYVQSIPDGKDPALVCDGTSMMAVTCCDDSTLFMHELGHLFDLTHPDEDSSSCPSPLLLPNDRYNVMQHASTLRQHLTEGQIIHAHMSPKSVLTRPAFTGTPMRYTVNVSIDCDTTEVPRLDYSIDPILPTPSGTLDPAIGYIKSDCHIGENLRLQQALLFLDSDEKWEMFGRHILSMGEVDPSGPVAALIRERFPHREAAARIPVLVVAKGNLTNVSQTSLRLAGRYGDVTRHDVNPIPSTPAIPECSSETWILKHIQTLLNSSEFIH